MVRTFVSLCLLFYFWDSSLFLVLRKSFSSSLALLVMAVLQGSYYFVFKKREVAQLDHFGRYLGEELVNSKKRQ